MSIVRVVLPTHVRHLAGVGREIEVDAADPPSVATVLDALEARYPQIKGTIRDHGSLKRRDFIRFFAGGEDLSHGREDEPLPDAVVSGEEVLRVVGAIAGG